MKQILNWTLGGFFRSFGRILCYLAIGGIIAFLIAVNHDKIDPKILGYKILGIDYVKASTITPSNIYYASLWCDDELCPYTEAGSDYNSGWLGLNTGYQNPAGHLPGAYLTHIKFRQVFSSSNYLQTNVPYVVQLRWNINPRYDFTSYYPNQWSYQLNYVYNDNTVYTDESPSISCSKYSSDNFGIICSFTILPTKPVNEFTFRILFPYYQYEIFNSVEAVNYKSFQISGGSSDGDAISSLDLNMTNQFNITNEIIEQGNQAIIDNQNENTEKQIESQQVCDFIDKSNVLENNCYINNNDYKSCNEINWGLTNYISIKENDKLEVITDTSGNVPSLCFYNINKTKISCLQNGSLTLNQIITIPTNTSFVRFSINTTYNRPQFKICKNGNQAINDVLTDDDVSQDTSDTIDFFEDFDLEGEATIMDLLFLPLNLIEDLSNQNFHDLCFTLKGKQACFPSGDILWNRNHQQSWFGNNTITINMFKTFFNLVVGGFMCYRILMAIVETYRKILDPVADATKVMKL